MSPEIAIMKVSKGTSANGEACCNPGILSLPANVRTVERERVIKGAPDSVFVPVPYEVQVLVKLILLFKGIHLCRECTTTIRWLLWQQWIVLRKLFYWDELWLLALCRSPIFLLVAIVILYVDNSYYNNQVTNTTTNVVHNPPTPTPTPTPNTENGSPENPVNDPNGQTNGGILEVQIVVGIQLQMVMWTLTLVTIMREVAQQTPNNGGRDRESQLQQE